MEQMDLMEELNAKLNEDFFETVRGEGEPIRFTPEEYAKCREDYIKFSKEESNIESVIRKGRALAASPDVYLTF
jgi:hypothetical protein